jgi:hypothetical protein
MLKHTPFLIRVINMLCNNLSDFVNHLLISQRTYSQTVHAVVLLLRAGTGTSVSPGLTSHDWESSSARAEVPLLLCKCFLGVTAGFSAPRFVEEQVRPREKGLTPHKRANPWVTRRKYIIWKIFELS